MILDEFIRSLTEEEWKYPAHLKLEMFAIFLKKTQAETLEFLVQEMVDYGFI